MSTESGNQQAQLVDIARAVGAILGVPLALYTIINGIIEQPLVSLAVAVVAAILASFWVVLAHRRSISGVIIAWLALGVLVLAGFVIWPRTMTVEGTVRDEQGNPIANELVVFYDCSNRKYEVRTDAQGFYQFVEVPSGEFRVRVHDVEVEGATKGILVRVVEQNLAVPVAMVVASPTRELAATPVAPSATPALPTHTPLLPINTPLPAPADTPTPQPAPTFTPVPPTDTPTRAPVLEKRFVVVYPLQDGVSLRTGPATSYTRIARLKAGTVLAVTGAPVRGPSDRAWWPVSGQEGEGWVAEFEQVGSQGWRLLKPELDVGDEVQVANPLCSIGFDVAPGRGRVILNTPSGKKEMDWGTRMLIIGGPHSTFSNDADDYSAAREGRQWWQVRVLGDDDVQPGEEGWVADFGAEYKNTLIAPEWYVSLSAPIAPPGADRACP